MANNVVKHSAQNGTPKLHLIIYAKSAVLILAIHYQRRVFLTRLTFVPSHEVCYSSELHNF